MQICLFVFIRMFQIKLILHDYLFNHGILQDFKNHFLLFNLFFSVSFPFSFLTGKCYLMRKDRTAKSQLYYMNKPQLFAFSLLMFSQYFKSSAIVYKSPWLASHNTLNPNLINHNVACYAAWTDEYLLNVSTKLFIWKHTRLIIKMSLI